MNGHRSAIGRHHAGHEAWEMPNQLALLVVGHRRVKTNAQEIARQLQPASHQVHPDQTCFGALDGAAAVPESHETLPDCGIFTGRVTLARFTTDRSQLGLVTQNHPTNL